MIENRSSIRWMNQSLMIYFQRASHSRVPCSLDKTWQFLWFIRFDLKERSSLVISKVLERMFTTLGMPPLPSLPHASHRGGSVLSQRFLWNCSYTNGEMFRYRSTWRRHVVIGYPIIGWCDLLMEIPRDAMASYEYLDNVIVFGMTLRME